MLTDSLEARFNPSVGDKTGEGLRLGETSQFELALWRERHEIAHQETGLLFREGESAN